MTDPDTANRTYIGPMTPELVESIIAKARVALLCTTTCASHSSQDEPPARTPSITTVQEKPDALLPTMGGQTALNLAVTLAEV